MVNVKQKGKRGELELAREIRRWGYDAFRGQQYCGAKGDADVIGVPWVHIECKRQERTALAQWMNQAVTEAVAHELPTVHHKRNRGCHMVTMELEDWMFMYDFMYHALAGCSIDDVARKRRAHRDSYGEGK